MTFNDPGIQIIGCHPKRELSTAFDHSGIQQPLEVIGNPIAMAFHDPGMGNHSQYSKA